MSLVSWHCNDNKPDARQIILDKKEKQLVAKEDSLIKKEQELIARENRLDSAFANSSTLFDSSLLGGWDVKMVCIETNCQGSAVGDTKIEVWELSRQGNIYIATAAAGGQVSRVYHGTLKENILEMNVQQPLTPATEPLPTILVRVNKKSEDRLEGVREITREDCRIVYNMEMTKK
jgi:hypothetical protein